MAVRIAMEHPIGALPRTPFPASRDFPSRGNEKYGEEKQASHILHVPFRRFPPLVASVASQSAECLTCHMTQKANPVTLLASPLGEEGHEVAKGWTVVILIMILDVDVTAEGGIIILIAR